jgi:RNA-directed DNA polymerase
VIRSYLSDDPVSREQRGEGTPETFTFLGFAHFCGQRISDGAFIVWRITAKKRMVAKLKAIKAELQRRRHDRMAEVGAWLRKVVLLLPIPCSPRKHDAVARL